jgi:BirA family biotin operon repressor/biotin-[acetyl-CoA-carboxylase] ligase
MRRFDVESFRGLLRTQMMGQTCYAFDVLASTNASTYVLGQLGEPEGTVVLADRQTAGRGQADKVWISPPRCNLYVSILLRPTITPAQAPLLSLLVAVAVVDALRQQGVVCGIKWPNDVLVQQRKVAGILAELELRQEIVEFVVVGIGINVNMTAKALQKHLGPIAQTATSVQIALGREIAREALLAGMMTSLEQWYTRFLTHGATGLQEAWEARSLMRGRRISAQTIEATWQGTAEGIDQTGHLQLRRDDGVLLTLTSAEVRFID